MLNKIFFIFCLIFSFTNYKVFSQEVPNVATVNKQVISLDTVLRAANELPENVKNEPFLNYYEDLLQHIIDITILAQEAKLQDLQNNDNVKSSIKYFTEKILMEAYLKDFVENLVSENDIKKSYTNLVNDKTGREEINAQHILVDSSEKADDIILKLSNDSSFEELAKDFSSGPSGPSGGNLGWFLRGQMVPAFDKAAFELKVGEFSKTPVQTQFGWHVIKIINKRVADPPSYEAIKDELKNNIQNQLIVKKIQELRSNSEISYLSASELQPLIGQRK